MRAARGLVIALTLVSLAASVPAQAGSREHRSKHRSRIEHVRVRKTTPPVTVIARELGVTKAYARGSCRSEKIIWIGRNWRGQSIINWWRSVYWCWDRQNHITHEAVNRGAWVGNQWWNLWHYEKLDNRIHTSRLNGDGVRYHYDRITGYFQDCWQFCFADMRVYVAQTIRADGTYDPGAGPKEGQL